VRTVPQKLNRARSWASVKRFGIPLALILAGLPPPDRPPYAPSLANPSPVPGPAANNGTSPPNNIFLKMYYYSKLRFASPMGWIVRAMTKKSKALRFVLVTAASPL
jgi:hypothetical protein